MTTIDSSCSKPLAFQPPTNLNAIRSNLLKRIHQKRQEQPASLPASPMSSTSSPQLLPTAKATLLLDHGLPSPPVEYQKKQQVDTMDVDGHDQNEDDDEDDAVSTISSLPPTNNTASASLAALDAPSSTSTSPPESWNAEQLALKIKQLKEEKHQLFTQMKSLLQKEEKPAPIPVSRPSPLKTCSLLAQDKGANEKVTQQSSLPSPSPSPTSTPKTMNLQAKQQKLFVKPTSLPSSRSSYHTNNDSHALHYLQQQQQQQQQYRRRRSSLTSNNCLSAAAAMMTTPRYHPHSTSLPFGTPNNMIPPNSSSMTMDSNGRYRYSPYGVYFAPISSPPSGYNVRRPSYLSSRSTSSLASSSSSSSSTIPVSSSSSNTFRPSRSLVNRYNPRY